MSKQPSQEFWVKDEFVLTCDSCGVEFGMSTRKHHCRACGQIFCEACTQKRLELAELGYGETPQRVCETCFTMRSVSSRAKVDPVIEGLKRLYRLGIKPLEKQFKFDLFSSPHLSDADFDSPPLVLLLGQYSTGKTTFITHLLQKNYPNSRVGPEPSTDKFVIVTKSPNNVDQIVPGNALAVQNDRPFRTLTKFGASFLTKLECAEVAVSPGSDSILKHISFVDTPGVLSGEKQRIGRSYDFTSVVDWFASRCDRILLLFDAHKLDISDEFSKSIEVLRGHDDKIRVVLNKADSVEAQQLMRVHGALMWSLGRVIRSPEVLRVYVGSFWDEPIRHAMFSELFKLEERDLRADLESLPSSAVVRKINEVVKRARAARLHALIIDHIRNQLPFFGREAATVKILQNLGQEFRTISRAHGIPIGDFPNPDTFRRMFETQIGIDNAANFPPLNAALMSEINEIIGAHIPRILALHNQISSSTTTTTGSSSFSSSGAIPMSVGSNTGSGGLSSSGFGHVGNNMNNVVVTEKRTNPFGLLDTTPTEGIDFSKWQVTEEEFEKARSEFAGLGPSEDGKLAGALARPVLTASGLPNAQLRKIWNLADYDRDGKLTVFEYALASHLVSKVVNGETLPDVLPPGLRPPNSSSNNNSSSTTATGTSTTSSSGAAAGGGDVATSSDD
jgi:GTPase SAR1 family protein